MKKLLIFLSSVIFAYGNIDNLGINFNNTIEETTIKNNSNFIQGDIDVINSDLKGSNFTLEGKINNIVADSSDITQSHILIDNAIVDNVTIDTHGTINSTAGGTINITNSTVIQSSISIPSGSSLKNSTIKLDSSIEDTNINNSDVSLCNFQINSGVSASGLNINGNCTLSNSNIDNAHISQGNIVAR